MGLWRQHEGGTAVLGQAQSHYEILERIGGGGMGVVYRALDVRLDRVVALKFLPPQLAANPDDNQRFIHEAKAASALDHPNICVIHDIDETEKGQLFLALAYYAGGSLGARIAQLAAVYGTE